MALEQLSPVAIALLALAAVVVGLSKTATAGAGTIAVAIFAAVLPAREATATLLLLLIVGDVTALLSYRRHAEWRLLLRLIPMVIAGLALGALFLALVNDTVARRVIGVILLVLIAVSWWMRRRADRAASGSGAVGAGPVAGTPTAAGGVLVGRSARIQAIAYGTLGGFTTMVANAGGPVMSMYFLALRFDVKTFLGTSAWFFAVVNLLKVPIVVGLGLLDVGSLLIVAVLIPGVLLGALAGRWLAARLSQQTFTRIVMVLTVIGAVYLLVR